MSNDCALSCPYYDSICSLFWLSEGKPKCACPNPEESEKNEQNSFYVESICDSEEMSDPTLRNMHGCCWAILPKKSYNEWAKNEQDIVGIALIIVWDQEKTGERWDQEGWGSP